MSPVYLIHKKVKKAKGYTVFFVFVAIDFMFGDQKAIWLEIINKCHLVFGILLKIFNSVDYLIILGSD